MGKSEEKASPFWQRILLFILTATLGAVGVFLYMLDRQKHRQDAHFHSPTDLSVRPKQAILVPPPAEPQSIQIKPVALSLKAVPAQFKRREAGTIQAKTQPGARCTISAKYSTRRSPTGLDEEPVVAGDDGLATWTWEIGTSGSYVDVIVEATHEQFTPIDAQLRVKIVD